MKTKSFNFMGKRYFIRGETESEIMKKMVAKRTELEEQLQRDAIRSITVNQWFTTYMQTYKVDISEYTYKSYEGIYRNSIQPYIGCLPITSVKPILCQQIMNRLSGMSQSYIHKTYILLRSLFFKAYENDLIEKPPVKGLNQPKGYKNERRALTDEERKAFIKATSTARNSALFCRIIYYCGLRPSEVARIRGGDYSGTILHVRGTKTQASTRDVPIPKSLKLPSLDQDELLFKTSSGNMIDKKRIREYWLAIKRDMGLPKDTNLTMYCLRHDYCTRLEEAGVPLNIASRLMGHSSVEITSKIYTHATQSTLLHAESLINQYNDCGKPSQKVTENTDFEHILPNLNSNKKCLKPLRFQASYGASWAIRTPNLLIRSGPKIRSRNTIK